MAPGDFGLMGRATCKTCKIPCREEEGLLGDRQLLGGLKKLAGGRFPPLLPCCRAGFCPTIAPARGCLGFVFFP